ncbi:MAG TPA: hypothetical protein VK929_00435 [Longimicrobiales bacterium]|nr:hypothetical protein [Longimicrobiales bacterium]
MTRLCSIIFLGAAVTWSGCTRGDAARPEHVAADAPSLSAAVPTLAAAEPAPAHAGDDGPILEPGQLRSLRTAVVHGRTGPDGAPFDVTLRTPGDAGHARRFGTHTIDIALRSGDVGVIQYPCTACHLGRALDLQEERMAGAHADLQVTHPRETGAACRTCHSADNVELLALRSGEQTTLDHAYRICAQCHFSQADAWAAGIHGKRLDGWQGRRVVMGCTDCHDPHAPALHVRLPFRPPALPSTGRRQP